MNEKESGYMRLFYTLREIDRMFTYDNCEDNIIATEYDIERLTKGKPRESAIEFATYLWKELEDDFPGCVKDLDYRGYTVQGYLNHSVAPGVQYSCGLDFNWENKEGTASVSFQPFHSGEVFFRVNRLKPKVLVDSGREIAVVGGGGLVGHCSFEEAKDILWDLINLKSCIIQEKNEVQKPNYDAMEFRDD